VKWTDLRDGVVWQATATERPKEAQHARAGTFPSPLRNDRRSPWSSLLSSAHVSRQRRTQSCRSFSLTRLRSLAALLSWSRDVTNPAFAAPVSLDAEASGRRGSRPSRSGQTERSAPGQRSTYAREDP
jgi:hypothetical protein